MPSPATVLVLIPVFGREDVFLTMAVLAKAKTPDVTLHYLVVDNGNEPELAKRLAALRSSQCEVIRLPENRGGAGAYRAGMLRAMALGGDFLWLLDDDALPNAQTLPELLKAYHRLLAAGVKVGLVGSTLLGRIHPNRVNEMGSRIVSRRTGQMEIVGRGLSAQDLRPDLLEVDNIAAASCLCPMAVLREVGPFEDIFIHYDDCDWCLRIQEAGYRLFVSPRSTAQHIESEGKFPAWIAYYDTRNLLWHLQRHFPDALPRMKRTLWRQLLLLQLHGCCDLVALMRLGIRHFHTGQCLLRKDLPQFIRPELPLTDLQTAHPPLWIIARDGASAAPWTAFLSDYPAPHRLHICRQALHMTPRAKLLACLRMARHYLIGLGFLLRHPTAQICLDYICARDYPYPLPFRPLLYFISRGDTFTCFRSPHRQHP